MRPPLTADEALDRMTRIFSASSKVNDTLEAWSRAKELAGKKHVEHLAAIDELRRLAQPDPDLPLFTTNGEAPKPEPTAEESAAGKILRKARAKK